MSRYGYGFNESVLIVGLGFACGLSFVDNHGGKEKAKVNKQAYGTADEISQV